MPSGLANALVFILKLRSPLSVSKYKRPRRRQRLRRPIKISAPIAHESLQLDANAAATMSEATEASARPDSGVFYLVTNKSGGKTIVRRPARPLSSIPLPEDFDVATQGATTLRGSSKAAVTNKRPHLTIRTTNSPVDTRSTAPPENVDVQKTGRFDPIRAFRKSFRTRTHLPPPTALSENQLVWKSEEQPPEGCKDEPKESRISAKAKEIRAWMMGKSGSDIHRSATYPVRQNYDYQVQQQQHRRQTALPNGSKVKSPTSASTSGSRGPRPGQTYEMVTRQIIENNQEKTVELSTWREQDHRKVKEEDAERISVYYISADEYAQELDQPMEVVWQAEEADGTTHMTTDPFKEVDTSLTTNTPKRHSDSRSQKHSRSYQIPHPSTILPPNSTRRDGTISPSTSEKEGSSERLQSQNPVPQSRQSSLRPTSPRNSTPIVSPFKERRRYKESTPILPQPQTHSLFHPTCSGSTISSIKSDSTLAFEAVLESCEPSLLHIAPQLCSLGIRKVEHLRAMARLTPATRDREVKEDALRLGVTVMEWAILVDRLLSL